MSEGEGISAIIGTIIISICIGVLKGAVYGWLTFGGSLVGMAIISIILRKFGTQDE